MNNQFWLRNEALLLLDKKGAVLDMAREVTNLLRAAGIAGAVIGGVAVVLHGHLRTTKDVDILVSPPLESLVELLTSNGFVFDRDAKEFVKHGVPVHLVLPDQIGAPPKEQIDLEGITTISLADLINMKLRSGSSNPLRAQDLADVIGLIRHHSLTSGFASQVDKALRPEFRKLVRLIRQERRER